MKLRILIVDDDFISRALLQELLSSYGDCHLVTNGREAIEILLDSYLPGSQRFDLVCLDIMMPEVDGHQVLRTVRRIEEDKEIGGKESTKIVMVTRLDDVKNMMDAIVVGRCEGYLSKPVERNILLDMLKQMQLIDNGNGIEAY